ncbi:carbon-nitrogen hydrolase family protein [Vibrio amylolyticus]|uniref:carbon-nitrogen hydrolase family protein n=1 Tax=Vibrio amylolyticus TaxID=2847292 RepID=UPI00354BB78C
MTIVISLAQVPVVEGDVQTNIANHLIQIQQSSAHGADIIVFPELSLTGYELDRVKDWAMVKEPAQFHELSQAAVDNNIVVISGCPLIADTSSKPTIGAVICYPDGRTEFYSKQYLHTGEERYCSAGNHDCFIDVKGSRIALAICADFSSDKHWGNAHENGADIYIASALISELGFQSDSCRLADIAKEIQCPVLLSNHISETGGWQVAGNNSIWSSDGHVQYSSDTKSPSIFLCTIANHSISTDTYFTENI